MQVKANSNAEVKLVFLGGEFHHILQCTVNCVRMSITGITKAALLEFGASVIKCASEHDEFILNGLVRVDIMKNNEGHLVLNELESLEARHDTLDSALSVSCSTFLSEYWEKTIYECIHIFSKFS